MIWRDRKSYFLRRLGYFPAFIAAVTWSLLPVLCPNLEAAEPHHSHAAFAESDAHHDGDVHQHPAEHDSKQCCTVVASAKFVAPIATATPAPKVVRISATVIIAKLSIDQRHVADSLLMRDTTGPPKRSSPKFTNYPPLAPPALG